MHDTCLPSFHHGTCPRRLNCQVFTSGRFIFFFDFLTLDLAGMILAFFSYFGFFGIFHWLLECSILLLAVGTPDV